MSKIKGIFFQNHHSGYIFFTVFSLAIFLAPNTDLYISGTDLAQHIEQVEGVKDLITGNSLPFLDANLATPYILPYFTWAFIDLAINSLLRIDQLIFSSCLIFLYYQLLHYSLKQKHHHF